MRFFIMYKFKTSGVYTIRCKVNGLYYVGCSDHVYARLNCHKCHLRYNKHTNPKLQNHFNTYGIENFEFELLEECNVSHLTAIEHYWCILLDTRKNGYNFRTTNPYDYIKAGRILNSRVVSTETRKKISAALTGGKNAKHSEFMKGNNHGGKKVKSINENIIFDNITMAGKHYNVSRSTIRKWIKIYSNNFIYYTEKQTA